MRSQSLSHCLLLLVSRPNISGTQRHKAEHLAHIDRHILEYERVLSKIKRYIFLIAYYIILYIGCDAVAASSCVTTLAIAIG